MALAVLLHFESAAWSIAKTADQNDGFSNSGQNEFSFKSAAAESPSAQGAPGLEYPTQTLSRSEVDAMRSRLAKLWKVNPNIEHPEQLFVTVRIRLNRDRRLAAPPQIISSGSSAPYKAAAQAAVQAVLQGQPYTMLRDETYDQWKNMDIDFDPGQFFAH
jgi:colicin import membrane protein